MIMLRLGLTPSVSYRWMVDLLTPTRRPSSGIEMPISCLRSLMRLPTSFEQAFLRYPIGSPPNEC